MTTKAQTETTERRVKKLLAKFAPIEQQRLDVCTVRDAAVKREREKFDEACKPFNTLANEALEPINEQLAPLVREIENLLTTAVDDRGMALFKCVDSREARAEVKQQSQRYVDPQDLLAFVPEADRTPEFWACLEVAIGKTSKLLGSKIDEFAEPEYKTPKVSLSLK